MSKEGKVRKKGSKEKREWQVELDRNRERNKRYNWECFFFSPPHISLILASYPVGANPKDLPSLQYLRVQRDLVGKWWPGGEMEEQKFKFKRRMVISWDGEWEG